MINHLLLHKKVSAEKYRKIPLRHFETEMVTLVVPIFQSPVNVLEVAKGNRKRSKREPEQDNAIRKYRSG